MPKFLISKVHFVHTVMFHRRNVGTNQRKTFAVLSKIFIFCIVHYRLTMAETSAVPAAAAAVAISEIANCCY